ncbi:MAG TPA: hypothetical protein EYP04_10850 [Anaerolineae bacterium]|nr:hypothetical protein [Anaerolineae bacterium]HIQ05274.1 hypothetical protein [Anaerolineae bacterium]
MTEEVMRICPHCDGENPLDTTICQHCGADIERSLPVVRPELLPASWRQIGRSLAAGAVLAIANAGWKFIRPRLLEWLQNSRMTTESEPKQVPVRIVERQPEAKPVGRHRVMVATYCRWAVGDRFGVRDWGEEQRVWQLLEE